MKTLFDIMDLSKMDKEQVIQLCEAFYELLKERNVTVTLQQPQPFITTPIPCMPTVNPQYPFGGTTTCHNSGELKS